MRRFARPRKPRAKVAWVRTFFSSTALDLSAAATEELVCLDVSAVLTQGTGKLNQSFMLRRAIFDGMVSFTPTATVLAVSSFAVAWAMYIADFEDTDTSIISTAIGSLLSSNRVLACGAIAGCAIEGTAAQVDSNLLLGHHLHIDARVNAKLRPDDLVLLTFQFPGVATASLATSLVSGYASMLVNQP